MKDFIINNLAEGNYLSIGAITFKLVMALIIGAAIYIAYYYSSSKVTYNKNFNFSLVAMTIITTAIMAVISTNIALSLGMVGALSIIRFRTAIKDPKDTMFIFWSIMVGICCGVSQYVIALATTAVLLVFYLMTKVAKEEKRYILIVRCELKAMEKVKALTYRYFKNSRIAVQNTSEDSAEFIYELKKLDDSQTVPYLEELYKCGKIECANFVLEEEKANV